MITDVKERKFNKVLILSIQFYLIKLGHGNVLNKNFFSVPIMDRESWLKQRKSGIGGSDAAGVCRDSRYKSPVEVFLDKTRDDQVNETANDRMIAGQIFEGPMLKLYEERTGISLSQNPGMIRHPNYEFLTANIDGWVKGSHIVEIKVISRPNYDDWSTEKKDFFVYGDIPREMYHQIMHYLDVTGLNEAHLFACIQGEFRLYRFKRDTSFILRMRQKKVNFWMNNVMKKEPPKPMTKEEVKLLHPKPKTDKSKEATIEDELLVEEFKKLNEEIKKLKIRKKEIADELSCSMGGAPGLKVLGENGKPKQIVSFTPNKNGNRILRCA